MDEESVRPEEAEAWLIEQGFHGGPTVSDAPPKFRHFTWLDSAQRAIQCHQFHAGAEFIYRAVKPLGWTSPAFSTPWAAMAYADLCGWGRDERNALDDYEEGTWAPALKTTGVEHVEYVVRPARYTKIGDTIYVDGLPLQKGH